MKFNNYNNFPSENDLNQVYDFCIIGSGASGSIAAAELVKHGFRVLMLERGPYITNQTYDDILLASEPAYARSENGAWSLDGYPWTTCNVGGGTVFYGGISFRYREMDFNVSNLLTETELSMKWPYNYSQLSPFYEEVERLLGISGDPSKDPFCPSDHNFLPNVPINYSAQAEILYNSSTKLGLKPFPTPLAILSNDYNGREKCSNSSACIENKCFNKSKSDSLLFLEPLFENKNFRIFSNINVKKLNRIEENKISSISCSNTINNDIYEFKAKCFIVACNAIQSARLLLNSKDRWSPKGIGNNYDMVGRTFCQKLSGYAIGYLPGISQKSKKINNSGPFSTIAFTDYYLSDEFPFKLGGLIYEAKYGFNYNSDQDGILIRLECIISDIPEKRNRIRINDLDGKVIIDYNAHPIDIIRLNKLMKKAEEILKNAGCKEVFFETSGYGLGSCHLHGTCRYSEDEKNGVLDINSKVYGIDNLYVIDGSFMPYPGSMNPTLTIQAHALKTTRNLCKIYNC